MPICTRCGAASPDNVNLCQNCGVAFSHQVRARGDAVRARNGAVVRGMIWVAVLVVLVVVGPTVYKTGYGAFLRFRLQNAKQSAMKSCNGPILAETPDYQKEQIRQCLATNEELLTAQATYDKFMNPGK